MSVIVPTVTASNTHQYREQMERITPLSPRLHVDFADGVLAPTTLISLDQAWLPEGKVVDFHLMYEKPLAILNEAVTLHPNLIIVHAEAHDVKEALQTIRNGGVKCGLALLASTSVESVQDLLAGVDHVLVFGGNLGYQGGEADLSNVVKIEVIRRHAPQAEIAWDGGVSEANIHQLSAAGVNVLNVGGYIQHAEDPATAYAKLLALAET